MTATPPEPRPFARFPRNLAPLGYREYALYLLGFTGSKLGGAVEDIGAVWLVSELTSSPLLLGLLGLARAIPAILLSPIGGVFADRVDQRRLLFLTQGLGLVASFSLGLLVASGQVQLWHVYLQVAIQATIESFDAAARQSLFPRLVPRSVLPDAVTLTVTAARLAKAIGPVIGGVAIASLGEAAPFFINAATYVILMIALLAMRDVIPRVALPPATFRADLVEGLRYILRAPVLRGVLQLEIVFGIFQINSVMITIIGRDVLGVGPEGLGGLLAAPAFGSLVAISGLLLIGQARRQGRFFVLCTFPYAIALIAFAYSSSYQLSVAILVGLGLLDALMTVTRQSIMQLAVPGHMRGRVMGNMGTVTRGTSPLAETQSGLLAGLLGPSAAVVVAAMAVASAAAAVGRTNPALWVFSRDSSIGVQEAARTADEDP